MSTTPSQQPRPWPSTSANPGPFLAPAQPELPERAHSPSAAPDEPQRDAPRQRSAMSAPPRGPRRVTHELIQTLRSALPTVFADPACRLSIRDDGLQIEGEVPSVAAKRRALRVAAVHLDVSRIDDRLRVRPTCTMSDATIADHVADALREEAAFRECAIRKHVDGKAEIVQQPALVRGDICVAVEGRVVTLAGRLPTHVQKRFAGVLAWWSPGARDVVDQLRVLSAEQDDDHALSHAVRLALEKDPFVDASQIRVASQANAITLTGLVWSRAERQVAENDAWSVFGVSDVDNRLFVAELA